MKTICAVCGRRTQPFAFLGNEPIGPRCAASMGLTKTALKKAPKGGRLRFAVGRAHRENGPTTLELFPETLP